MNYHTEKQIMPSNTTINWLFNDIWCYLSITCFDWKIKNIFWTSESTWLIYLHFKWKNTNKRVCESDPVETRRQYDVVRRRINVETTSCVYGVWSTILQKFNFTNGDFIWISDLIEWAFMLSIYQRLPARLGISLCFPLSIKLIKPRYRFTSKNFKN